MTLLSSLGQLERRKSGYEFAYIVAKLSRIQTTVSCRLESDRPEVSLSNAMYCVYSTSAIMQRSQEIKT